MNRLMGMAGVMAGMVGEGEVVVSVFLTICGWLFPLGFLLFGLTSIHWHYVSFCGSENIALSSCIMPNQPGRASLSGPYQHPWYWGR